MLKHVRPLAQHPQLSVTRTSLSGRKGDEVIEYRVENYRRWADGTVVRGDESKLGDSIAVIALALGWKYFELGVGLQLALKGEGYKLSLLAWLILLVTFLYLKTRTVLYQSATPLPALGLQISTTRGLSLAIHAFSWTYHLQLPLSTASTFVPLEQISTIVINEGLRRWRVQYYLAIITKGKGIIVAYDEVRSPVAVLREVYHGLREALYDEYEHNAT